MRAYRKGRPEKRRDRAAYARQRRADPALRSARLATQRSWYAAKGADRQRLYYAHLQANEPWRWRARVLRSCVSKNITLAWLRATWATQGGRCAISGRPLDIRTVQGDHIVPTSRGGTDDLSNIRLTSPEANAAKSSMMDEELVALCIDIIGTLKPCQ